jgi:hypothetical protein
MKVGDCFDNTCDIGGDYVDDFSGATTDTGQDEGFAVDQDAY